MHHTKMIPAEPASPDLKNRIVAALSHGRLSVILCILTIFVAGFCAAHLAKNVLDAPQLSTFTAPDAVMPLDLVAG